MLNAFNNLNTNNLNDIKIEEIDDDEPRPSIPRDSEASNRDTFKSVDPESEITNLEVFKGNIKKTVDQQDEVDQMEETDLFSHLDDSKEPISV